MGFSCSGQSVVGDTAYFGWANAHMPGGLLGSMGKVFLMFLILFLAPASYLGDIFLMEVEKYRGQVEDVKPLMLLAWDWHTATSAYSVGQSKSCAEPK